MHLLGRVVGGASEETGSAVAQSRRIGYVAAMRVLGIESSCDETAAAVVQDPRGAGSGAAAGVSAAGGAPSLAIVSNVIYSQVKTHARFGGIVPEVASREHVTRIVSVVQQALDDAGGADSINAVAVTTGPGLVGSLLVGMQAAKGFAMARRLPWVGVNHLEGHLSAALLAETPPAYPHVALVVSGGHTHLYRVTEFGCYELLGGTRDDAAGEAFDKVAKVLGLGYPGGIRIDALAQAGDPRAIELPRGLPNRRILDFSFSGLKTAAADYVRRHGPLSEVHLADFCASFQEAVADALTKKAVAAARRVAAPGIVLAGGVAANSRLRALLSERCTAAGLWAFLPPKPLCTDNGAMIGAAGWMRLRAGERGEWSQGPRSRWPLSGTDPRGPEQHRRRHLRRVES